MRNKLVKALCGSKEPSIPMNIQLFADGGGDDGNGGNEAGGEEDTGGNEDDKEDALTFDGFMSIKENKAELDRRTQIAVNTAVGNAKEKWKILADEKATEAEKLAKMNKVEQAAYLQKQKELKLKEREIEITMRELKAEAKNTLVEKGLPIELAEVLVYTDADASKASIEAVEKAFQTAVQAGIEERIKGGKPQKAAPEDEDEDKGNSASSFVGVIKENQSKR